MVKETMSKDSKAAPLPASLRVLVLDDNEDFLELLAEFFEVEGCTAFTAATLDQARDLLQREEIDIALLDFNLTGGKDSLELFHQIRRTAPLVKLFLVTGYLRFHELSAFFEDRLVDSVLMKPFSLEQLRAAILAAQCPPTAPARKPR